MLPLRTMIVTIGLRKLLALSKQRSVLRMLWSVRAFQISELLTGGTDQKDENKVLSLLRESATADQLAWVIRSINAGEIPFAGVGTLSGGWWLLDDELERSAVTSVASRLIQLFDRRDSRTLRDAGAIRQPRACALPPPGDPAPAVATLVADLALRGRRAEAIGALVGLD